MVNTDGHTWTKQGQREKYLTHAGILEKEVAESNKPRDIFYLAQSYRDAFEPEKAIEWYRKRVFRNDGFYEEVYYSQFMIGNLYSSIGESEKAIIEWMKCFEIDLLRAEHILNMIIEHQKLGLWKMAYIFSKIGMEEYHGKNPYPKRVLFIDEPTYSHKLKDLYENLSEKIEA
jgi:tetratricopeptide (TPR) repeat protein